MNTAKTTAKNTGLLILSDVIGIVLYYLLIIAIARNLGDVEFGKFSFAFSFVVLFAILADLGVDRLMVREVARNKSKAGKYMGNAAIIKIALSCFTFILIFIVINALHYPPDTIRVVYVVGISVILTHFAGLFRSMFYAFEQMQYEALTRVLEKAIVFALGSFAVFSGWGLIGAVAAFLVSSIFSVLFSSLIAIKKFAKPALEFDLPFCKNLVRDALPFGFAALLVMAHSKIDVVMLSMMKGDAVVGWYSAAYKMIEALNFVPAAFSIALFPAMSRYFETSKKSLELMSQKSLKFLVILGAPIAVGTTILADKLILFLYGTQYVNSIAALQILIWAEALIFLTYLCTYLLGAINRQKVLMYISGFNVMLNISLNLLLIPKFSLIGASVATLFTICTGLFLMLYFISKSVKIQACQLAVKPMIAGAAMGIILVFLNVFPLFVLIPAGAFVYFGTLVILRTFSQEDINLLRAALKIR